MMKRKFLFFVLLLCLLLVFPGQAEAKSSVIHKIDIEIELLEDGEAIVHEVWDAEVYEGTEVYLVKNYLSENKMRYSDLKVQDESGKEFELLDVWHTSASREEKAYKAGYHYTSDGVELCFGIGEYGAHTYNISYRVKNFLVGYKDGTPGFHVRVVNDQMSAPIESVLVKIRKEGVDFSKENAKIWSFGYLGEISFLDDGLSN